LQLNGPRPDSGRPIKITAPDLHHPTQGAGNRHRNVISRVEVTDVNFLGGHHKPPITDLGRDIVEPETDHGTTRGTKAGVDVTMQIPHEQLGIEIFVT
jgi:hypothetical protein